MTFNSVEVLIPTMHKTLNQIKEMCSFWNLKTDAIISVQCDYDGKDTFIYLNHKITVIFSKTRGVSKNRNILLNALKNDIGIFIDDDCSMCNDYEHAVLNQFNDKNCLVAYFNGYNSNKELITKRKTTRVKSFNKVSYAGGPGIAVTKKALDKYAISFNEKVGTPNKIFCGEDSLFVHQCVKLKIPFYRFSIPLFKIEEDLNNSTYFKGFDEQFFRSKGAINKIVHPHSFLLYYFYFSLRLVKRSKKSPLFIIKNLFIGSKLAKDII